MKYVFLCFLLSIFGCRSAERRIEPKKAISKSNSLKLIRAKQRDALEKEWYRDSLKDELIVKDVIAFVKKNKSKKVKEELRIWKDTSISVHISVGHLFSSKIEHLVIRSHVDWRVIIYVYRLDNFKRKIRDDWSDLTYIGNEIKDINGDGKKDFVINWYPSSGCCARNNYHVYLYQKGDSFTHYFDFINPTFSPKEHLVRGVDYGHPGEVPLYKYKWNGEKLDTIEYIYPADTVRKKFYVVKHYGDDDDPKKRKMLNAVPREYKKLDGYDWFINY